MGWALKRPDGTYRCWNANAQDDIAAPGEVWVALTTPPPSISVSSPTLPNPLKTQIDLALASSEVPTVLKVILATWKTQL